MVFFPFFMKKLRAQPLSPQGCLVVKLDLQKILQIYLCYIIHDVPEGARLKKTGGTDDQKIKSYKLS